MKLAILGSSAMALEVVVRFHLHGASLTWFNEDETKDISAFESYLDAKDYTSESGRNLLQKKASDNKFSYQSWRESYYLPLVEFFKTEQKVRSHEVVSVTKRFLAPQEEIEGKSRFHDLFRIIFQVNPQEFIEEQAMNNPETFKRLTEEFKLSLQSNLEMYEDFDLVLDLRHAELSGPLSITGRALGEFRVSPEHMKYGKDALELAQNINENAQDVRELALVGSGPLALEILLSLETWLKDQRSRLFIVSEEARPFEAFLNEANGMAREKFHELLQYMEDEFQRDITTFHEKLREWQNLDDFVQVKVPKPVEPIPRLVFFSGHNATAVDQLVDKRRLFLTLEKPDFREGLLQPENNQLELKTIGVDRILVATAGKKPKMQIELASDEVGFLKAVPAFPNVKDAWQADLQKIIGIENEIFKLFSPADSH